MSFTIINDCYTLKSTTQCDVSAVDDKLNSKIWFRTPALTKDVIDKMSQIQIQTVSRDQGEGFAEMGSWSWFDIVILESPNSSEPKKKDNLELVWFSHDNDIGQKTPTAHTGNMFDGSHEIFRALEVGNSLAVRVCAQYHGWENHATEGGLVLRFSKTSRQDLGKPFTDAARVDYLIQQMKTFEEVYEKYLKEAAIADGLPEDLPARDASPLRADQARPSGEPPLRVLSLDGGGVRGISSLLILQAIMNNSAAKPCNYFDMIAGTSTGGLIAIMLGRLQMSIPECIKEYETLSAQIFSKKTPLSGTKYDGTAYEDILKKLIKTRTGDEHTRLLSTDKKNTCKVFVTANRVKNLNNMSAEIFRSYPSKHPDKNRLTGCQIWEAARATSAAPLYLPKITINGIDFVDGGLRFNNPSLLLYGEIRDVYHSREIGCFLSIGTGRQPNVAMKQGPKVTSKLSNLYDAAKFSAHIATDCETTHSLIGKLFKDGVYWRFNAGVQKGDDWEKMIALDDHKGMPTLKVITNSYIKAEIVRIAQCTTRLGVKLVNPDPKI